MSLFMSHRQEMSNTGCHRLHWRCIAIQKYYTYEVICLATLNPRVSGKFERMIDHAKWHVQDLPQILKARFIVKTKNCFPIFFLLTEFAY